MKIITWPIHLVSLKVHIKSIWHGTLQIKHVKNGFIHQMFHPMDIENVLGVDNHDE